MADTAEELPERRPRVTIRQIAETAGVSIATVSRVLNGREDVAPETRELVRRVIREEGYLANRGAAGRHWTGPTGVVGLLVPMVQPDYYAAIVSGIADALAEENLGLLLYPTDFVHDREISLVARLSHGTADGAILVVPQETREELDALRQSGYRFVVLDPRVPLDKDVPTVSAANSAGAEEAVRHLIGLGHRRIAAITGPSDFAASVDRLRGYELALAAAGIAPDADLIVAGDFEIEGGAAGAARLLDGPEPPTAIFGFNDKIAIGAIQAAQARGLRVPEDLSVVGFDDLEHAPILTPALTTVHQPIVEMGWMAVRMLLDLLARRRSQPAQIELRTHLVVRKSTCPPPNRGA
jgi:LacI family transcriptional regulator